MERITIVGLRTIGASIGLGLKQANLNDTEIVGTTGDRGALSEASKKGAVDKTTGNLGSALEGAQLVILDAPISEMREMLEAIGPVLDDGCTVTDTGAAKVRVMEWADEYLPRGISFVGGHPLLKKRPEMGDEADVSLFAGIDYCIIPAKSADQQAVKTVVRLAETLSSKPIFMDAEEHDSYAAAMAQLPQVISSAFVTSASSKSGWREMHRLAASEFEHLSSLAAEDPEDTEADLLANPDALVVWLDNMIAELYSYRNQINDRSEELFEKLIAAWEARARWKAGAVVEERASNAPTAAGTLSTAMFGTHITERFQRLKDSDKKKSAWKYTKNR